MAYTASGTLYDVLELNTSASKNDIKDAYRRMALKRHPDKNPHDRRAVAKFQEVDAPPRFLLHTRLTCVCIGPRGIRDPL